MHSHKHTCMHLSTPHPIITPLLQYQTSNSNTNKHNLSLLLLGNMPVNPISQEHSQIWPWEAAMYANLHYHHEAAYHYEKEHMFEKPLTPSDVGKLNRLVIPKQHAERYFPLGGDSSEKGLLLSFEDEAGKPWRFRYSYWTSSQSYVLTKGWSRYVKEKRLDAGDVVLFERVRGGSSGDRLFIGCRRRGAAHESAQIPTPRAAAAHNAVEQPWSPMCYSSPGSYPTSPAANSYLYLGSVQQDHGSLLHAGDQRDGDVRSSSVATPAPTSSRRLRLFGVNLDCGPELPEPEETAASMYSVMHQTPCTPMSSLSNYWTSS